MGKRTNYILLIFCFLVASVSLFAETIYLKSGEIVYGQITQQSVQEIEIRTSKSTRVISKDDIKRIAYTDPTAEEKQKEEARQLAEEKKRKLEEKRKAEKERKEEEKKRKAEE